MVSCGRSAPSRTMGWPDHVQVTASAQTMRMPRQYCSPALVSREISDGLTPPGSVVMHVSTRMRSACLKANLLQYRPDLPR
jgi:hypothetical protein